MPRRDHRKRAILFLAAVLLPSAVLVGTTLRLIRQQRELAIRRAAEDRSLLALRVGQRLQEELRSLADQVPLGPLSPREMFSLAESEPAIVALARDKDGQLVFPADHRPDVSSSVDQTRFARYARLLARGEEAEYRRGDFSEAARFYGQAADVWMEGEDSDPGEMSEAEALESSRILLAEARVHEARALFRAHRSEEARSVYRRLAEMDLLLLDEAGMPFALYGLEGLQRLGAPPEVVLPLLERTLSTPILLCPTALTAWREVARGLVEAVPNGAGDSILQGVEAAATQGIAVSENLEQLRRDFPGLLATSRQRSASGEPVGGLVWIAYGETPWVVGIPLPVHQAQTPVLVVDPARILDPGSHSEDQETDAALSHPDEEKLQTALATVSFLPADDRGGEALGPTLRGLRASFPPDIPTPPGGRDVENWFFRLLLPLILLLTGFAAFMAWRDVRREMEASRLRSQFVSSVTHELKTPLTSIRMFAETLRLGRLPTPEAREQYLDMVLHETERLSRLIHNVLDFSRIDRGEKSYHMAATDVATAAREAARAVAYPLEQGGYTLEVEIAEDLPRVEADGDALTQALLNLLSNAIKFSPEGSRIDLRVFREDSDLLMQVQDRGRGIAPPDREAIFQDFFRGRDAEAEGIPGTGLGLPLVRHVAKAHRGLVEVESEVGKGSTFTLRIPVGPGSSKKAGTP